MSLLKNNAYTLVHERFLHTCGSFSLNSNEVAGCEFDSQPVRLEHAQPDLIKIKPLIRCNIKKYYVVVLWYLKDQPFLSLRKYAIII